MRPTLAALTLTLVLAAANAPADPPSSLYPTNKPLYPIAPAYQPTVQPGYAPTPVPQPTSGPLYAPTPMGQPGFGAAPAASSSQPAPAVSTEFGARAAYSQQVGSAQSGAAPSGVAPPAGSAAPAAAGVQPGGMAVNGQATVASPAAPQGATGPRQAYVQATPAAVPDDPWRRSQQVLNEIGARERDGSLAPEKAVALRAELEGLRGGSKLRRPSDVRHLSSSQRRYFLKKMNAEDAEIRRDASQPQP